MDILIAMAILNHNVENFVSHRLGKILIEREVFRHDVCIRYHNRFYAHFALRLAVCHELRLAMLMRQFELASVKVIAPIGAREVVVSRDGDSVCEKRSDSAFASTRDSAQDDNVFRIDIGHGNSIS